MEKRSPCSLSTGFVMDVVLHLKEIPGAKSQSVSKTCFLTKGHAQRCVTDCSLWPCSTVQGRVLYANGHVLTARFVDGHVHGPAIIAFSHGTTFYGAFRFSRRQGVAMSVDADGQR